MSLFNQIHKHWRVCLLLPMLAACEQGSQTTTPQKMAKQSTNSTYLSAVSNEIQARSVQNFNHHWLFNLADDDAFKNPTFDDSQWRSLILPHDWSVELDFTQEQANGATGYLPAGKGWYRKHFKTPEKGSKHTLYFDGIYNHAKVYVNGQEVGNQIYGYTPVHYDITQWLNPAGESNVVAVSVDRSRYIDSRWYTGSGIYRDVQLISTNNLHIPMWGTYITTPEVTHKEAKVALDITVDNAQAMLANFTIETDILGPNGDVVAKQSTQAQLNANEQQNVVQNIAIANPQLWGLENAHMYRAHSKIIQNQKVIDEVITPFGIRTIEYDANKGFFLNGKNVKIKGVNLHHDAGLVGAAVPDDVWKRRLLTLKAAGVNAIRVAHNPASEAFLNLCDELGLLVQSEIFDEWDNPKDKRLNQNERHDDYISRGYADYFQEHAEADLKAAVKRDRNHPSIIMWSIGNEIEWTYPRYAAATGYFDMNANGDYFFNPPFISPEEITQRLESSPEGDYVLAKTAKKLSKWVKELDTTRPVTANLILPSVSHISGYTDALDIIGYSYRRVIYDYGHRLYPDKMIMGNENVVQWHEWKAIEERDFIAGTFLWTGIDYLGESHGKWPTRATASGMLNTAGFDNPSYHMMKSLWHEEPHVYMATQTLDKSLYKLNEANQIVEKKAGAWQRHLWYWHDVNRHWQYQPNELVAVEIYTNCEAVELFLNETSQGIKKLADNDDHILKWSVPYQKGNVSAKGLGQCNAEDSLSTAGEFAGIAIQTDKKSLTANYTDAAHITVQLTDKAGNPIRFEEQAVHFETKGPIRILGVDNGAKDNVQRFQADNLTTSDGRALFIVQATGEAGEASIVATSGKVSSDKIVIQIK